MTAFRQPQSQKGTLGAWSEWRTVSWPAVNTPHQRSVFYLPAVFAHAAALFWGRVFLLGECTWGTTESLRRLVVFFCLFCFFAVQRILCQSCSKQKVDPERQVFLTRL